MKLIDFGIEPETICEIIVTTYHEDGVSNAAPMGVRGFKDDKFILNVHSNTDTYKNIIREGCCALNIVFDPLLFLKCALSGRNKGSSEIETKRVSSIQGFKAPFLSDSFAYISGEMVDVCESEMADSLGSSSVARTTFQVERIVSLRPFSKAPNRGLFSSLELAIALSRGRLDDVQRNLTVIKKTLPRSISKDIETFVNSFLKP